MIHPLNILGITGAKQAGKTTVAAILERLLVQSFPGITPRTVSFADPVRAVVQTVYGVSPREMSDPILKETQLQRFPYKSPRQLMQEVGTEMFRSTYPDVWIKAWERTAVAGSTHEIASGKSSWVLTPDVRFPNEAAAILSAPGGVIIRVVRPDLKSRDSHSSEAHWRDLPVTWEISNNGSLTRLQSEVENILFALLNT